MTVKQRTWRFASLLAAAVIAGTTAALPADDLPWSFNGSYQTVGYPVVGNSYVVQSAWYVPAYSAPATYRTVSSRQSSGCSTCSPSYYAQSNYAPSYGYGYGCGCGPVAVAPSCNSCGTACGTPLNSCDSGCSSTPTPSKPTQSKGSSRGFHPTKKDEPEANRGGTTKEPMQTFVTPSNRSTTDVQAPEANDGLSGNQRIRSLRTDDQKDDATNDLLDGKTEARKPAANELEPETVIEKIKKVPAPVDINGDDQDSPSTTLPELEKKSDGEAKIRLPLPSVSFDDKIAWRAAAPRTRIPFYTKTTNVSVSRRVPNTGKNSDWTPVATKQTGPQLVKK